MLFHEAIASRMTELRPCWRCDDLTFWRGRDNQIHCTRCEPARACYVIAERLRASPRPLAALERATGFSSSGNQEPTIDVGKAATDRRQTNRDRASDRSLVHAGRLAFSP